MLWESAHHKRVREKFLQNVFDHWDTRSAALGIAGAPRWLTENKGQRKRPNSRSFLGYRFRPDSIWLGEHETLLFELKAAKKYEPLAIAEVLHHQYMLANERRVEVVPMGLRRDAIVPVIVGQYNSWTRATLAQLRQSGWNAAALRYLEFEFVHRGSEMVLWLDDPFAAWDRSEPPPDRPPGARGDYRYWYRVKGQETWFGVTEQQDDRPVFISGPQINITAVVGLRCAQFVAWESAPKGAGTYWMGSPD